jgi:ABC-type molybdate transport system substrate-binding protein
MSRLENPCELAANALIDLAKLAQATACVAFVSSALAEPSVLRIAAAADLRFVMNEVIDAFRQKYPNVRVEVTYGSSGNFYAQLSNHAPFDIFFSADVDYPRRRRGCLEGAATAKPHGEELCAGPHIEFKT